MAQTVAIAAHLTTETLLTVVRRTVHVAISHAHHIEVEAVETVIHLAHHLLGH